MEGPAQQIIHQFKYGGLQALAPIIVREMADLLREWAPPFDAVAPIPLHPRRLRERGFDQAELLARGLAVEMDVPFVPALRRIRPTSPQARGLSRDQRYANVADAFLCAAPGTIDGRRFMLVDDVTTTGATLAAAARPLRESGSETVWAITAAHEV
jgi:ComF family protein